MQYRVLGPLEVLDDGEPLNLAGPKQRALLALLLLRANQIVTRDALIDGLWGDKPPRGADHSLEAHVSRLRKLLRNGRDLLVTRPGGYVIQVGDDELDLDRFERLAAEGRLALRKGDEEGAVKLLRRALSLWRGAPLEDVEVDPSLLGEIRDLEGRRLAAYEDLVEAALARGQQADLLPELEQLVRANPLRERLQAQLMLALYRSGRQADALEAYRNARRRFSEDLGIEPGPELRELEQAILRQDVGLRANDRVDGPSTHAFRSRRTLIAVAIALAVVAGAVSAAVLTLAGSSSSTIPPDSVGAVDPNSGKIVRSVRVGVRPIGLAVAAGRIWVASLDSRTITRVDPGSGAVVDVLSTGGAPTAIAGGAGAVWVADGFAGKLVRLDPSTGELTDSVTLGGHPSAVTVDRNAVWTANAVGDAIQRIDPRTLDWRNIRVGSEPTAITAGAGSIWAANDLGRTLTRIDSATAAVLAARIPLRSDPDDLDCGSGSIWVTEPSAGTVTRIDPRTGRPQATIPLGGSPGTVRIVGEHAWVGDRATDTLVEIDVRTNDVVRRLRLGASPQALALADGHLWVAASEP